MDAAPHFLPNLLFFTRMLRRGGIPISVDQVTDFTRGIALVDIGNRAQVYYTARCLLVTRLEHIRLFDTLFNRFWRVQVNGRLPQKQKAPLAPRHKRPPKQFNVVTYMAYKAREADEEIDVSDKSQTYSRAELLQRKDFSQMTPEELATIKRLMQEMRWQVCWRQTRRRVPDNRGETLHLRRMLRSATKYGGVPITMSWQKRKMKQRPFILLADISGSMEKYARLLLQFFYSVSHTFKETECFVFGTRLTRITPSLKLKNIDRAVDDASRQVIDWSGGTRIGDSFKLFNRQWSRRVLRRGAVVLVVSDGWERGDTTTLQQEIRYLQHRSHRLIWLNPLLGQTNYQPLVAGMAAALPYIDDFLPIHNWQSLIQLSDHMAQIGSRRSERRFYGH